MKITIDLDADVDAALNGQCLISGLSREAIVERALRGYLIWMQVSQREKTSASKPDKVERSDAPNRGGCAEAV